MKRVRSAPVPKNAKDVPRTKSKSLHASRAEVLDDVHIRQRIAVLEKEYQTCTGPESIARAKLLWREIQRYKQELEQLEHKHHEQHHHHHMDVDDSHAEAEALDILAKVTGTVMPTPSKLIHHHKERKAYHPMYPTSQNDVNDNVESSGYYAQREFQRSVDKAKSILTGQDIEGRETKLDICECGAKRIINKEFDFSVCTRCAKVQVLLAAHIFDMADSTRDKDESVVKPAPGSNTHLMKYNKQIEYGFPQSNEATLDILHHHYRKMHERSTSKVQPSRTNSILVQKHAQGDIPKTFRWASERLTKELKGQGIPEFYADEMQQLTEQRNCLKTFDTLQKSQLGTGPKGTKKKTFTNSMLGRQLGLSNRKFNSRLFLPPRTMVTSYNGNSALEHECLNSSDPQLILYPSC